MFYRYSVQRENTPILRLLPYHTALETGPVMSGCRLEMYRKTNFGFTVVIIV